MDAKFSDALPDKPLNLGAMDLDDLRIIASLAQDAVFSVADASWNAGKRQLAFLINRYRWEYASHANATPERVRSLLVIDNVLSVSSMGIDRSDKDLILSLLDLSFEPAEDGAGEVLMTLAGDGAIRAHTEALEVRLKDVTRPYRAPSGKRPDHDL